MAPWRQNLAPVVVVVQVAGGGAVAPKSRPGAIVLVAVRVVSKTWGLTPTLSVRFNFLVRSSVRVLPGAIVLFKNGRLAKFEQSYTCNFSGYIAIVHAGYIHGKGCNLESHICDFPGHIAIIHISHI